MITVLELIDGSLTETSLVAMHFHNRKWVDVSNPSKKELIELAQKTGISLRDLQENADPDERPKTYELEHYTVIAFKSPLPRKDGFVTSNVSFFISENLLLTIHQKEHTAITRLLKDNLAQSFLLKDTHSLLVALLEEISHSYFHSLDDLENRIDKIEDRVLKDPSPAVVGDLFKVKKMLIFFHKALTANMDVIRKLEVSVDDSRLRTLRYVHDDIHQMVDVVATYRDLLTSTLDIYLSSVSNNMNAIMKRMTAWASVILIPTLITGLYGMNFQYMPELSWRYGYAFAWGTILLSIVILSIYFKKKDWF